MVLNLVIVHIILVRNNNFKLFKPNVNLNISSQHKYFLATRTANFGNSYQPYYVNCLCLEIRI